MPISAPSQIGLDMLRSPALAGVDPARAERRDRPGPAAARFELGETGDAKTAGSASKPDTPASFKRFEAMVLQTFIQNMLPRDGAAVYGKGMAGDMWKSLLAEKVAEVMADRGGIGIADRVLGERYEAQTEAKPAIQEAVVNKVPQDEPPAPIAPIVVEGMQRSLSQLLTDGLTAPPQAEIQSTTRRG
ncbi:MAG: rod-binding protein [Pseudomonadota bacterium]|nr:rod-binding protein [Pseudomonadota bacterium]